MNYTKLFALLGITILPACQRAPTPLLPAQKDFGNTVAEVFPKHKASSVQAIMLKPNLNLRQHIDELQLVGVSAEDSSVYPLEMVSVLNPNGQLYYNDNPHGREKHKVFNAAKLDLSSLNFSSTCGQLNENLAFSPVRDVLCSVTSGYTIQASQSGTSATMVMRPLYHTTNYSPYSEYGISKPEGDYGYSGSTGRHGTNGANGRHGADGSSGYGGSNGGDGENGTNGEYGRSNSERGFDAARGIDGQRGDDGPNLQVVIRPIYSKFYPNETLAYMEINASWPNLSGDIYKTATLNYIFHQNEPFVVSSIGGDGGKGGNGGRGGDGGRGGHGGNGGSGGNGGNGGSNPNGTGGDGGDGGNGGNGGNGGDGAMGGNGGDGANGGDGGNGGYITVDIYGNSSFINNVTSNIKFRSIGGRQGARGIAGNNGLAGDGGSGGSGGRGGRGGSGGSGMDYNHNGKAGKSGYNGKPGKSGYSGPKNYYEARNGYPGRPGIGSEIKFFYHAE